MVECKDRVFIQNKKDKRYYSVRNDTYFLFNRKLYLKKTNKEKVEKAYGSRQGNIKKEFILNL